MKTIFLQHSLSHPQRRALSTSPLAKLLSEPTKLPFYAIGNLVDDPNMGRSILPNHTPQVLSQGNQSWEFTYVLCFEDRCWLLAWVAILWLVGFLWHCFWILASNSCFARWKLYVKPCSFQNFWLLHAFHVTNSIFVCGCAGVAHRVVE